MYTLMIAVQTISIVLLLFEIIYMVSKITNNGQSILFLFVLEILINNIGYLLELLAQSSETAIMGTCVSYIGKAYLVMTAFTYVMYFCQIKIPKVIIGIMMTFHSGVLFLVFAHNQTDLYYSSVNYVEEGLFPHLEMGRGPVYYVFMASIVVYVLLMLVALGKEYAEIHSKAVRRQILCLTISVLVCMVTLGITISGYFGNYDYTAFGYFVASLIFMFGFFRYGMFENLKQAKEYVVDNIESGVVILDTQDNLMYHNPVAEILYPELNQRKNRKVIEEIKLNYDEEDHIFANNKVYRITREEIIDQGKIQGILYMMIDITETYDYTERLKSDVRDMSREVTRIQHAVISGLADMVEARDDLTGMHIHNTSLYVAIVAKALQKKRGRNSKLTDEHVDTMIEAAPLHDIGKIAISDTILCKPGKLTPEEFETMKTHTAKGAKMIDDIIERVGETEYLLMAKDMAYYHHERWDGTGYPQGLKGEEIPLCARIMAVADVYDALRSKRSYKEEFSEKTAVQIMKESSGTHFDPELVDIFLDNISVIEQV